MESLASIDEEELIDGVSQALKVTDFDIERFTVLDGRLAFENQDAFVKARHKLAEYNEESILAWSNKIGFRSLFAEKIRLEQLSREEIENEISQGLYSKYFIYNDEFDVVDLKMHSTIDAMVYNTEGIVQLRSKVGIMVPGLNIWTTTANIDLLVEAISNNFILDENEFRIFDKKMFEIDNRSEDVTTVVDDCWTDDQIIWPWTSKVKNPDANRRIRTQNRWILLTSEGNDGKLDYDAEYWIFSESFKGTNNRYKTNHYLTINVDVVPFWGVPLNAHSPRINTDIDTHTKWGNIVNHIEMFRDVDQSNLDDDGIRLLQTHPGINGSGLNGTGASHRGMGNLYLRHECI